MNKAERPVHRDVNVLYDVRIPTADPEVTLSADVYLPSTCNPVPALLTAIPYRKDITDIFSAASFRWFAERGYASVLIDLRGTGSSDGTQRPKCDPEEGEDALAAIEWIAAEPWCSGTVGMWGISYGGVMTLRTASLQPPQLKAIIPIEAPLDPGRDAFHHDGARVDLHQRALWSGSMLVQQLLPPLVDHTSPQAQRRWRQRLHETEPFLVDLARGPDDPVWRERAIDPATIAAPALCVGGWRDLYADAITRLFEQLEGPKKLLIGPWMHSMPQDSPFEPIDFPSIALRWWYHWLLGLDTGVMDEPPITVYIQGARPGWRAYDAWPPANDELVLATSGDTTLTSPAPDAVEPARAIAEYQPDPTIGALSGLWGIPTPDFGLPLDEHDDDARAVSTTSDALPHDVLICGRANVTVTLAQEDGAVSAVRRIVVRLTEVDAKGRSTFITAGVVCPREASETYRIALRSTSYRVRAGNRLRVVLSDSDFPRLTPLANPRPIPVARISLAVAAVDQDAGVAVEMPATTRRESPRSPVTRRWRITRDPIHDGIEVAIGRSIGGVRTSQGHLLELHGDTRATVRRAAPAAAVIGGDHGAVLRMTTGEVVRVRATIRCGRAELCARAAVEIDGTTVFTRLWEVPLGD